LIRAASETAPAFYAIDVGSFHSKSPPPMPLSTLLIDKFSQ
jgi:hypothetical protein